MQTSFLFQIFKTLDKSDLYSLRKWVNSPSHNQKPEVAKLAEYLAGQRNNLDSLQKATIFTEVFGEGTPFNALRLNRVLSDLTAVLRDFLGYQEWKSENDGLSAQLHACRALRKRAVGHDFERQFVQLDRESRNQPYRNADWQHFRYRLYNELVVWRVVHDRESIKNLHELHEALGNYFMLETLRWSGMAQSLRTLSGAARESPFANIALENAGSLALDDNPPVALMLLSLRAIQEGATEEDYANLKQLIANHAHLFPAAESRDFYMAAINFCIRRHNRGEMHYTKEALEIYREALTKGVLLDNGVLATYAFNNIHALAQLLGELEWAQQFLEEYRQLLPPYERENIYRYNMAIHHFRGGRYNLALELLRDVQFSEVFINLDVRRMLLRSYFELGEWMSLASLLDSFASYIRRQKELGYHRASYLNLLKYTKKIMKTTGNIQPRKAKAMADSLREEKFVAEREWLLRILER